VLIIHAVQKLLNTSNLKASLFITAPNQGQYLHDWYARLLPSGFPGKMMVMYVHNPSLMAVICKGKTIQGTWENFIIRLEQILRRFSFPEAIIKNELMQADGYIVSRTDSRSILGFMNQMVFELGYCCDRFDSYDAISLDILEDSIMSRLYQCGKNLSDYRTALQFWAQEIKLEK
jgi:hypothetical protein